MEEKTMIVEMSKGRQITIPSEIRDMFDLEPGMKLEIGVRKKEIILKPVTDELEELFAEARHRKPRKHFTAEQMDALNQRLFR
ncbi:AbrB/MazE/SpoVT family DNA-binding domain-containing protein [Candidatus Woesearchaeota archaeon]|nr:AbrB/MazE/SpoVT family DNA-binding domain-containing protein [Candidatus Woesearchaeota archaeon]